MNKKRGSKAGFLDTPHYTYTAPEVEGDYSITIKDSAGSTRQLNVSVFHPLRVSPGEAYIGLEEKKTFKLSGDAADYDEISIVSIRGTVSQDIENRAFDYTAPEASGPDFIFITDANGDEEKVKIEVTPDFFFLTPSIGTLFQQEKRLFKVVGGTGTNFQWSTGKGEITAIDEFDSRKLHTAPGEMTGSQPYFINVTDGEKKEASAVVHVITDQVVITPGQIFLKPGEQAMLEALLGTGAYQFVVTGGSIEKLGDTGGKIRYTAPERTGEFYVTVYDTAGNSARATVNITGGYKKPEISKSIVHNLTVPENWPNSRRQPIAAGEVQHGGTRLEIAADFPNYRKEDGTRVTMNYYAALYAQPLDGLWLFWGEDGMIHTIDDITPLMSGQTDVFYNSLLSLDLCDPSKTPKELIPPGEYQLFGLAVESAYDPGNCLELSADAVFEVWQILFTFQGCPN